MKKEILLFSLITVAILAVILLTNIVSAQMCEIIDVKNTLRKALFDYLPNPQLSKLNANEIRDLLNFYLTSSNLTTAKCDIKATLSNISYDTIVKEFSNFTINVAIPYCEDGTHYGKCSATKPKYCFAGQLVNRCRLCGCLSNQSCQINETAEFTTHEGKWGKCLPAGNITCRNYSDCPSNYVNYTCQNNNVHGVNFSYMCTSPGAKNSTCLRISGFPFTLIKECNASKNEYCIDGLENCQVNKTSITICSDKTYYSNCSTTKPLYCSNGTLINKCAYCGCPSNQTCQINGNCTTSLNQTQAYSCTDSDGDNIFTKGHTYGIFMGEPYDYWDDCYSQGKQVSEGICILDEYNRSATSNQIRNCPAGAKCYNGACINITTNLTCSDRTNYSNCSTTKPLYCSNGTLINNCNSCGCLSNQTCHADGSCAITKIISNLSDGSTEKNLTFNETGNQTIYVEVPPDAIVTNATLDVTPTANASLDVGSDGDIEVAFNKTNKSQTTPDLSPAVNKYIISNSNQPQINESSNQTELTGTLIFTKSGNILVPFTISSSSAGTARISNINIAYISQKSPEEPKLSFFARILNFIKQFF